MTIGLLRASRQSGIVAAVVVALMMSPPASASLVFTTITFEEPGLPVPAAFPTLLPSQIGGMQFSPAGTVDPRFPIRPLYDVSNLYGHINLSVSGPNGLNLGGNEGISATVAGGGTFNFVSMYFGSTHGAGFSLSGYRNGLVAFSAVAGSPQFTPTQFIADWKNIDALVVVSLPYNTGYNVMDNLTYSVEVPDPPSPLPPEVPEPSTIALICMAGFSLFGFSVARQRAKRQA